VTSTVEGSRNNPVILSFDDGPIQKVTPKIIEILRENNVKAIFFVVGSNACAHKEILQAAVDSGNELGNHSYSHREEKNFSILGYYQDIMRCQKTVYDITGKKMKYFRPPFGKISFKTLVASRLAGLKIMMWTVDCKDWSCSTEAEAGIVAERIQQEARAGDIVLLHDGGKFILEILTRLFAR
jgi:peptidoglycan/xylan/chitin deacetylase (PgdA/CDA1 family)